MIIFKKEKKVIIIITIINFNQNERLKAKER